jgi:hypothetical protein
LHIDDRPLLQYIKTQLGCGIIEDNKDNTASYFIVTDTSDIKSTLLPIFDSFSLNTTKYLDYLSFFPPSHSHWEGVGGGGKLYYLIHLKF